MNRDNQQESKTITNSILNTELAWLAGMLNGDGCFSLIVRKKKGYKSVSVELSLILTQTDAVIIERAARIIEGLTNKKPYICERGALGVGRKNLMNMSVNRMGHISIIITCIEKYLCGNKAARARLMLEYINRRLDLNSSKNPTHDDVSWSLVEKFYRQEKKKFPPEVQAFLRD
tara:strand:+ start:135 stop:656 length:522 start_codon:yes stop_codon:yes gene_type:complete